MTNIETMSNQYLETALWSSNNWDDQDDRGHPIPFDDKFVVSDFTGEARRLARRDCKELLYFLEYTSSGDGSNLLQAALQHGDYSDLGYDFWLTRAGHGAGFWDGDWGDYGDAITKIVNENFGEVNPCSRCDGKVGFE